MTHLVLGALSLVLATLILVLENFKLDSTSAKAVFWWNVAAGLLNLAIGYSNI